MMKNECCQWLKNDWNDWKMIEKWMIEMIEKWMPNDWKINAAMNVFGST